MALNNLFGMIILNELEIAYERLEFKIQQRHLRDQSDPFSVPNTLFCRYFRLNKVAAHQLIIDLREYMIERRRNTGLPLKLKVLMALYFFGHGSFQKCVSLVLFFPTDQTVFSRALKSVINSMNEHLLGVCIKFPTTPNARQLVRNGFQEKFQMPGVIGAIDCTHIAIIAPKMDDPIYPGHAYLNRKGYYSLNVQMICDSYLKILNVNARFPGSSHDSAIWSLSAIKAKLENDHIVGINQNSWLIGDSGYPLQPWLLTPVLNALENTPEEHYNKVHIRARNTIEHCFGVLKQRFRCLLKHRTLHYHPTTAGKIVNCCAILHNICINHRLEIEIEDVLIEPDAFPVVGPANNGDNWLLEG